MDTSQLNVLMQICTRVYIYERRQDKIECVALKQLLENEKEEHKKTKAMLLKARRKSTVLGERLRNRKIYNIAELKACPIEDVSVGFKKQGMTISYC